LQAHQALLKIFENAGRFASADLACSPGPYDHRGIRS
jgi:hypothetical protein